MISVMYITEITREGIAVNTHTPTVTRSILSNFLMTRPWEGEIFLTGAISGEITSCKNYF